MTTFEVLVTHRVERAWAACGHSLAHSCPTIPKIQTCRMDLLREVIKGRAQILTIILNTWYRSLFSPMKKEAISCFHMRKCKTDHLGNKDEVRLSCYNWEGSPGFLHEGDVLSLFQLFSDSKKIYENLGQKALVSYPWKMLQNVTEAEICSSRPVVPQPFPSHNTLL